jgi:hypothetical protein
VNKELRELTLSGRRRKIAFHTPTRKRITVTLVRGSSVVVDCGTGDPRMQVELASPGAEWEPSSEYVGPVYAAGPIGTILRVEQVAD